LSEPLKRAVSGPNQVTWATILNEKQPGENGKSAAAGLNATQIIECTSEFCERLDLVAEL